MNKLTYSLHSRQVQIYGAPGSNQRVRATRLIMVGVASEGSHMLKEDLMWVNLMLLDHLLFINY